MGVPRTEICVGCYLSKGYKKDIEKLIGVILESDKDVGLWKAL